MVSKIGISLHGNPGKDGLEEGTFAEPYPKAKVKRGNSVIWVSKEPIIAFKLKFQGSSPFIDGMGQPIFEVTHKSPPLEAWITGSYHYSVHATDGVNLYDISSCPELDVG